MYKHVAKIHNGRKIGVILLGVWLILTGIIQVFGIQILLIDTILALLAVATGTLFLLSGK